MPTATSRRHRPRTLWRTATVLVGLFVAGCGRAAISQPPPSPTVWVIPLTAAEGTTTRLNVVDSTGLVTAVRPGRVVVADVAGRTSAVDVNTAGDELAIEWGATSCSPATTVAFGLDENAIGIRLTKAQGADCDSGGSTYRAILDLSAPVGDRPIVIMEVDRDANSWGMALLSTDGRRRPALVLDRSRRVASVAPARPSGLDPGAEQVTVRGGPERAVLVSWVADACDDRAEVVVDRRSDAIAIEITLADEGGVPCGGPPRSEGIAIAFSGSVDAGAIVATVIR